MATRLSDRAKRRYRRQREKQRLEKNRKKAARGLFKRLRFLNEARKARKKRQKVAKRMQRLLKVWASMAVSGRQQPTLVLRAGQPHADQRSREKKHPVENRKNLKNKKSKKTANQANRPDPQKKSARYGLLRNGFEQVFLMSLLFGLLGLCVGLNQTFALSLGTQGAIYPIIEPDLLTGITQTLQLAIDTGEWANWQREWQLRTQAKSERPDPVAGVSDLPADKSPRVWVFDPTVTVNRDITVMRQGKRVTLATQGERLNPLSAWPLKETLIFVNGDNAAQLAWLQSMLHKAQRQKAINPITIILVRGNVKTTATVLQHRIYFDQFGALCQRFGITHTPTRVTQAKRERKPIARLQLEEIRVESSIFF